VNFDVLMERNSAYRDKEQRALKQLLENPEQELEVIRVEMKKHFVVDYRQSRKNWQESRNRGQRSGGTLVRR
jgi:hypothetical protein